MNETVNTPIINEDVKEQSKKNNETRNQQF